MCMDVILDTLLLIIQSMGCVVLAAMQKKKLLFFILWLYVFWEKIWDIDYKSIKRS